MHRILDNRVGGISARSFRMFRNLCGEDSLCKVVITTTMWDQVERSLGEEREKELVDKEVFFKPAVDKGARLARHDNTLESAQAIIRSIVQSCSTPVTLKIQEELSSGLCVMDTQAGKEVNREILEQIERHRTEMYALLNDLKKQPERGMTRAAENFFRSVRKWRPSYAGSRTTRQTLREATATY